MTEAAVRFAGNLTAQPEVRFTEAGVAGAMLGVAVRGRREQEASFFTVVVWRDQGEPASRPRQGPASPPRAATTSHPRWPAWRSKPGSRPVWS